jgi:hypothetical protein
MNPTIIQSFHDELEKLATVINPKFRATPGNLAAMRAKVQNYYHPTKVQRVGRKAVRGVRKAMIGSGFFKSTGLNVKPRT